MSDFWPSRCASQLQITTSHCNVSALNRLSRGKADQTLVAHQIIQEPFGSWTSAPKILYQNLCFPQAPVMERNFLLSLHTLKKLDGKASWVFAGNSFVEFLQDFWGAHKTKAQIFWENFGACSQNKFRNCQCRSFRKCGSSFLTPGNLGVRIRIQECPQEIRTAKFNLFILNHLSTLQRIRGARPSAFVCHGQPPELWIVVCGKGLQLVYSFGKHKLEETLLLFRAATAEKSPNLRT